MNLPSTKYGNNQRTVSANVIVQNNDVVLRVDTSLVPCTINLNEIVPGYWNTPWRLYIYDATPNASINNITINAGTGQTINGFQTLVINTNSVRAIVSISSDNSFMCSLSNFSGGGLTQAYTTVEDEGIALPQRFIMNFVGAGVTATDAGGKTIVTIPGAALISLTNAQMLALIAATTVIPGQFYLITDGGISNGGVVVQGITTASSTTYGAGLFLNADYQNVGNYSGVSGFVAQLGIWSSVVLAVSVGNVVIYNNNHYRNITGSWGTAPSGDTTNWAILTKGATTGFILEVDFVKYDVVSNTIVHRADKRNNIVDGYDHDGTNTLLQFQWGRNASTYNKIMGQSSWQCTNSYATIIGNIIENGNVTDRTTSTTPGTLSYNYVSSGAVLSCANNKGQILRNVVRGESSIIVSVLLSDANQINDNYLEAGGIMQFTTIIGSSTINKNKVRALSQLTSGTITSGNILENFVENESSLIFTTISSANVTMCSVSDTTIVNLGALTTTYMEYKVRNGYSNWPAQLDYGVVFSGGTLTIPVALAYVGIFTCINCTGSTAKIINAPAKFSFILKPANAESLTITIVAVSGAVATEIVGDEFTSSASLTATGRTNGGDQFTLSKLGNIIGILQKNIWQ